MTKDARAEPMSRPQLGVENQSFVFSLFEAGSKFTVRDIYELARARKQELGEEPLNERTVRRAIAGLAKSGFLVHAGRHGGAVLFAKQGTSAFNENANLIPLGGDLVTVEHFLRTFADPSMNGLKLKRDTLSVDAERAIKQMLLFAIVSAGEPGLNEKLQQASKGLRKYLAELKHATKVLETFLDSAIWYEQYRDRIAYEVRRTQEKNPELYQLTLDAIKGG